MSEEEKPAPWVEELVKQNLEPRGYFGPEDIVSAGEDDSTDPIALIKELGHDPENALEWVVTAIVDAHPADDPSFSREKRVRQALEALRGVRRGGRPPVNDHRLLLAVAWEYHVALVRDGEPPILRPIVKQLVEKLPPEYNKERGIERHSLIEGLEDKFNKNKEILISRATMDDDWQGMDEIRAVKDVVRHLNQVGIPANPDAVQPTRLDKSKK